MIVENVGKLNPKRHIYENAEKLMS